MEVLLLHLLLVHWAAPVFGLVRGVMLRIHCLEQQSALEGNAEGAGFWASLTFAGVGVVLGVIGFLTGSPFGVTLAAALYDAVTAYVMPTMNGDA